MIKKQKMIILGGSASGKDFLVKQLINKGESYSPKLTTRPIRENETEGVEYNFTSNQHFLNLLNQNKIKTYQKFTINDNDWYYGITTENYDTNNIFIMTPHEIKQLSIEDRESCFIIWLSINDEIRRKRLLHRNDNNDSIDRRINADNEDFKDLIDYDMKIMNEDFEINLIYDYVK